ncbi:unnamed protein product, partial [Rotaria sp. Silwood2]
MSNTRGTVCYRVGLVALHCGWFILLVSFIHGIIFGSISAARYVQDRRTHELYTNTSCLLLNYTVVTHECQRCEKDSCYPYPCFDEQLFVSYVIFNGTFLSGSFVSFNQATQHQQAQIGIYYPCLYKRKNVTSVVWDISDGKSNLIKLCVCFGIIGLSLMLLIVGAMCWMTGKKCEDCS